MGTSLLSLQTILLPPSENESNVWLLRKKQNWWDKKKSCQLMRTGVVIITNSNHLGLFRISKNWWDKKSCHLMRRRVVCCKWLQIVLQTKSSLLHNLRMSRIWYGMVCPLHCWSSITFVPDLSSLGGKVGISRHSFTPSLPYLTHLSART